MKGYRIAPRRPPSVGPSASTLHASLFAPCEQPWHEGAPSSILTYVGAPEARSVSLQAPPEKRERKFETKEETKTETSPTPRAER